LIELWKEKPVLSANHLRLTPETEKDQVKLNSLCIPKGGQRILREGRRGLGVLKVRKGHGTNFQR